MAIAPLTLKADYWETIGLEDQDIELLYNHLLELETPLPAADLTKVLIKNRLQQEQREADKKQSEGGKVYLPKDMYQPGEKLVFPTQDWKAGEVVKIRDAVNYSDKEFKVIAVKFEDGEEREYAAGLEDHVLNIPPEVDELDPLLNPELVFENFSEVIEDRLIQIGRAHV